MWTAHSDESGASHQADGSAHVPAGTDLRAGWLAAKLLR